MKYSHLLPILLICSANFCYGQNYKISSAINDPKTGEYCFYISGDQSTRFLNTMTEKYSSYKTKNYEHNFKDITISGISDVLELTVFEGVYHVSYYSGGCCSGGGSVCYFKAFSTKKSAKSLTSTKTRNDSFAVAIYVSKSKTKYGISTREEAGVFIEYLKTIIGSPSVL